MSYHEDDEYDELLYHQRSSSIANTDNPIIKRNNAHSSEDESLDYVRREDLPDMWSFDYVGLYCQYAAVGLLYGSMLKLICYTHTHNSVFSLYSLNHQ